jgi:putative thioredoxin
MTAEAEKAGVTGSVAAEPVTESEPEPEPIDPDQEAAYQAMENADWGAAVEAFQRLLQKDPADAAAKAGLASAQLYQRAGTADPVAAVASADADPPDVSAALAAADLQAAGGDFAGAFARLIDGVRRTAGDDRAQLRNRLLELFEVVGPEDPQVAQARIALANALF